MRNVILEDIVCTLFPYTYKGKALNWYFPLETTYINSWKQFKTLFLQNFRDDSTPEYLLIDLLSFTINPKGVKDYNQRFSYLKNGIPKTLLPTEELLIAYYINGFPITIDMWVKHAHKMTLQLAFVEACLVEKDMYGLKDNPYQEPE